MTTKGENFDSYNVPFQFCHMFKTALVVDAHSLSDLCLHIHSHSSRG